MEFLYVKNWRKYQHYGTRTPPWIKLHFELLSSADWVSASDAGKVLMVVCMLVASRNDGKVPKSPAYLKRVGYLDRSPNLNSLIECGFLSETLADASDTLASASPEKEKEVEKKERKKVGSAPLREAPAYGFQGDVIRLTRKDLDRLRGQFSRLNGSFDGELSKADAYYRDNPRPDGKYWFAVQKWLERAQSQLPAKRESIAQKIARNHGGTA